jgi:hypothetical protein
MIQWRWSYRQASFFRFPLGLDPTISKSPEVPVRPTEQHQEWSKDFKEFETEITGDKSSAKSLQWGEIMKWGLVEISCSNNRRFRWTNFSWTLALLYFFSGY